MEDSLKGVIVSVTLIGLFITSILSFITFFPQEQGASFNDKEKNSFLEINITKNTGIEYYLEENGNKTKEAYNQWDISVGFMGTNQIKQSQESVFSMVGNVLHSIKTIVTLLFGSNSPIMYALIVLSALSTTYLIYQLIKFVRTGN